MSNNTGHDWTMRGGCPDEGGQIDRVLVARSPCGRVNIEVHQDEGLFWDAANGGHQEDTHYIVSVYASNNYDYHPRFGDGEWIDHDLVAHIRPGTSGQGWAPTFAIARNLLVNGIIAVEKDGKWISGSLNDSHREYVHPRMTEEEAIRELRGMFRATATPTDRITRDDALELARDHERWGLAEYLYSLTEDDFAWLMTDLEQMADANTHADASE